MNLEKHRVHGCSQHYPHLRPLTPPGSSRAAGAAGLGEVWTAAEAGRSLCVPDESRMGWPGEFASLVNKQIHSAGM